MRGRPDLEGWGRTDSGLYVPEAAIPPPRPQALDLFCGAGGFSLGMERGGFDVAAACENDATAAITYLYNLGAYPCQFWWLDATAEERMEKALRKHMDMVRRARGELAQPWTSGGNRRRAPGDPPGCRHFFFGDVRNLRGDAVLQALGLERGELACVFGGSPCQGFSIAGRRNVMDPRNSLVFEFVRLVVEIQPQTMVLENVPGMLSMVTTEGVPVVDAICLALQEGGYGTYDALRRSLTGEKTARAAVRDVGSKGPGLKAKKRAPGG